MREDRGQGGLLRQAALKALAQVPDGLFHRMDEGGLKQLSLRRGQRKDWPRISGQFSGRNGLIRGSSGSDEDRRRGTGDRSQKSKSRAPF
jgi:hypothetical protein